MSNELAIRTPRDLLNYFDKNGGAIESVLPKHLQAARMKRLAVTLFRAPTAAGAALRKCTPQSILDSLVMASLLGLEPGVAGQGYLIPYNGQCTFVPGWQGLVGLLNNTGRATAWTGAVFEGDQWEYQKGSRPRCVHIPGPNDGDPDKLTWVYACGRVNGSEQEVIEAWTMHRVWRHRDRYNKVGKRHYSFEQPEMYARKVVLLQVLKYMPRSIELNNAMTAADAAELGQTARVEDSVVIIDAEPGDIPQAKPTFEAPKLVTEAGLAGLTAAGALAATAAGAIDPRVEIQTPEPKKPARTKTPVNEPPGAKETIIGRGVSFSDFRDWMEHTGRNAKAQEWTSFDTVPDQVWLSLTKLDMVGVAKCVTLYGTPTAQPATEPDPQQ